MVSLSLDYDDYYVLLFIKKPKLNCATNGFNYDDYSRVCREQEKGGSEEGLWSNLRGGLEGADYGGVNEI